MAIKQAALASRWMSVSDISERLTRARENRERQQKLLDTLEGQAKRRREDIERSLADLPPFPSQSACDPRHRRLSRRSEAGKRR